ncbi:hypothetical protein R1sor_025381 [Riccia sorocarpa]|uniref:Ubiquitin-like domain-containing protein n=1 Tax=Riccia sorocarpa TaxID=122646 RepID=A0ABD3G8G3_9MARC
MFVRVKRKTPYLLHCDPSETVLEIKKKLQVLKRQPCRLSAAASVFVPPLLRTRRLHELMLKYEGYAGTLVLKYTCYVGLVIKFIYPSEHFDVWWDAVENKSAILVYGAGALVELWLSSTVVGAINFIPL